MVLLYRKLVLSHRKIPLNNDVDEPQNLAWNQKSYIAQFDGFEIQHKQLKYVMSDMMHIDAQVIEVQPDNIE